MDTGLLTESLDSIDDIFYIRSPDGECIYRNEAMGTVTGYSEAQLDEIEFSDLFIPEDAPRISDVLETVETERTEEVIQAKLSPKDSQPIAYEISLSPLSEENSLRGVTIIGRDVSDKLSTKRRLQQLSEDIRTRSMPIVEVWDGVVLTTVVGSLDTRQAEFLTEELLDEIVSVEASSAIIDITGLDVLDTATAQHLIDTINAVNLLGSRVVITGISPDIAQTLVQLGIPLNDIETKSSLMEGLRVVLEQEGVTFG